MLVVINAMIKDIILGFYRWELWTRLAWNEIQAKYRRSAIGPLWASLNFAIFVGALGILYSELFRQDPKVYVPHLVLGLLVWNLLFQVMMEGCHLFSNVRTYIDEVNLPLPVFVFVMMWRNIILLAFSFLVFIIVAVVVPLMPDSSWLLSLVGLILVTLNALWLGLILAIISARFHDLVEIVGSALRIVFFITPILWMPGMEGRFTFLLDANPFYHLIEIFRSYIMGNNAPMRSWVIVILIAVTGWSVTGVLYNKYRNRIAFWI